jgi:NADH-quinone oxidoreductase subunit C
MISDDIRSNPEAASLEARDPTLLIGGQMDRGELTLEVNAGRIVEACRALRASGCNLLSSITVTDWYPAEPRFRVVYHLLNLDQQRRVRLAARVPGDNPRLATVIPVWPNANWYEREVFDLFGIQFDGHPNLTRLLLPDEWEGHPLRKDYPIEGIR